MKTFNYSTRSTRPDFQGDFLDMMLQATNKPNLISFAGGLPNPISFPTQEMAAATQKYLISMVQSLCSIVFQKDIYPYVNLLHINI